MLPDDRQTHVLRLARALIARGEFTPLYPALGDADRHAFEEHWSMPMPPALRAWLELCNGTTSASAAYPNFRGFTAEALNRQEWNIVARNPSFRELGWPPDMLPIADDGCGNTYVLTPAPPLAPPANVSKLWVAFWDREADHAYGPDAATSIDYFVASDLWRFLNGCFEFAGQGLEDDPLAPDSPAAWPFARDALRTIDPIMAEYDGPKSPWRVS